MSRTQSLDLIGYVELTGKASVTAEGEIEGECQSLPRGKAKEKQYEELVSRIDRRLKDRGSPFKENACIYRVPPKLRRVNEEAYTPQVVSIGPFHHGKKELKQTEKQKLEYLHKFFERGGVKGKLGLEDFVSYIKKNEACIRECYLDSLEDFSSDEFVEMILLDAIFILELFLRMDKNSVAEKDSDMDKDSVAEEDFDHIADREWPRYQIQEDLILLENQLPFFLLKELHSQAFPNTKPVDCPNKFFHLAANFFENYAEELKPASTTSENITFDSVTHFTDFLRKRHLGYKLNCGKSRCLCKNCSKYQPDLSCGKGSSSSKNCSKCQPYLSCGKGSCSCKNCSKYLLDSCCIHVPSNKKAQSRRNSKAKDTSSPPWTPLLYSATKLHEAGVKFREMKIDFLQIRFDNGNLKIPNFTFYDGTECIFRNMMALEQCTYPDQTYICDYVVVLDYLINTAKDVELLVEEKIMINMLGDHKRAANIINKLCLHIATGGVDPYSKLIKDLNKFYEGPYHRRKATLIHEYFRTPWRSASTLAAFLLLVLTLTQTIFTIIQTTSKK